ncbi:MAG: hypothetical protein WC464_05350 [Bdellovibrionales bacterium]
MPSGEYLVIPYDAVLFHPADDIAIFTLTPENTLKLFILAQREVGHVTHYQGDLAFERKSAIPFAKKKIFIKSAEEMERAARVEFDSSFVEEQVQTWFARTYFPAQSGSGVKVTLCEWTGYQEGQEDVFFGSIIIDGCTTDMKNDLYVRLDNFAVPERGFLLECVRMISRHMPRF